MKFTKIMLLLALLGATSIASARTLEMDVNGLVCAFCAQGIEKSLKAFPATEAVFVSLENRIVAVKLRKDTEIGDADLRKAITDAGFTIVAIRRTDESLETIRQRVKQK